MDLPSILQIISAGANIAILIIVIKATRQFSRIELKVETMWDVFVKRFGHYVKEN